MKGKALWGREDQQVAKAQEGEQSRSRGARSRGGGRGDCRGQEHQVPGQGPEVNAQVQR